MTALSALLLLGGTNFPIETVSAESVETKPKRFALLIGISNYKGGKPSDIDGCVNNIDLLRQTLPDWGFDDDAFDKSP